MTISKTAGAAIYIQEELSDARLRCDELKHLVMQAINLVHASEKRDHFYGVAGDIIHAVPEVLLKLERALQAAALAVNELDESELRQVLRPEKIDALERALEDLRIRIPKRTGTNKSELDSDITSVNKNWKPGKGHYWRHNNDLQEKLEQQKEEYERQKKQKELQTPEVLKSLPKKPPGK